MQVETVETIERKMRRQRIALRLFLVVLLIILCFFVGWLISYSTYDGLDSNAFGTFFGFKPLLGLTPMLGYA